MADLEQIRSTVERAASKRLNAQVEHLRREIVEEVVREIAPLLAAPPPADGGSAVGGSSLLYGAIAALQDSHAQADILKSLLEGGAKFSARAALFVVRGTSLAGWQARGLTDENIRGLTVDGSKGLASRVIHDRARTSGAASEFDSAFIEKQGSPHDGNCTLFPLVVKDKVAAVLYCDSGRDASHSADVSAVDVLTRFACLWLEHESGKKTASAAPAESGLESPPAVSAPVAQVAAPEPSAPKPVAIAPEPSLENVPADEQELHKKARRFAKLLVDEIKLYNQTKVAEGKQNRDLYKLLREDIEKSRATYEKRYGSTPAASAKYFDSEIVRILADNDRSLLGSDFPG
jgi:hypothetical protein